MRDLPSDFHAVPLNRLAIPGTQSYKRIHIRHAVIDMSILRVMP